MNLIAQSKMIQTDPNLGFVSDLGQDFNGLRDACNELNDVTDLIDLLKKL